MKHILIGVIMSALVVCGCTTMVKTDYLNHEVVTLDSQIAQAQTVKTGILNHATLEGKQDSPDVKAAVEKVDAYIDLLSKQKEETQAVIDARAKREKVSK